MSTTAEVSQRGFPVVGILLTIFILAKIFAVAPVAAWSWWWVFSPLWIPLACIAAFFSVFAIGWLVLWLLVNLIPDK